MKIYNINFISIIVFSHSLGRISINKSFFFWFMCEVITFLFSTYGLCVKCKVCGYYHFELLSFLFQGLLNIILTFNVFLKVLQCIA
jgi:hypothetical protein